MRRLPPRGEQWTTAAAAVASRYWHLLIIQFSISDNFVFKLEAAASTLKLTLLKVVFNISVLIWEQIPSDDNDYDDDVP